MILPTLGGLAKGKPYNPEHQAMFRALTQAFGSGSTHFGRAEGLR